MRREMERGWTEGRGWRGAGDGGGVSIIPVMVAGASIKASVLSEKKAENTMEGRVRKRRNEEKKRVMEDKQLNALQTRG